MNQITQQQPIQSKFDSKTTAREVIGGENLQGKNAIVTGGYSGVGLEITRALANAGVQVLVPVRNPDKARQNLRGIPNIAIDHLDLLEPDSIDAFAQRFLATHRPLHLLINDAGIMAPPLRRDSRGYESQFSTNHLGHFHLTARLWPALVQAQGARVVAVSSRAQRLGGVNFDDPNFEQTEYESMKAYAQSKSANVLFVVELDKRGRKYSVRAFAAHPGLVAETDLGSGRFDEDTPKIVRGLTRTLPKVIRALHITSLINAVKRRKPHHIGDEFKTVEQGAATPVWCAVSAELDGLGGVYCEDCNIAIAVPAGRSLPYGVLPWAIDPEYAVRLWVLSEQLTGVEFSI